MRLAVAATSSLLHCALIGLIVLCCRLQLCRPETSTMPHQTTLVAFLSTPRRTTYCTACTPALPVSPPVHPLHIPCTSLQHIINYRLIRVFDWECPLLFSRRHLPGISTRIVGRCCTDFMTGFITRTPVKASQDGSYSILPGFIKFSPFAALIVWFEY